MISLLVPFIAAAETTKEKVERKRELLVASMASQADEVTRRIVARIPEIQKRIEVQKEFCGAKRDCRDAMDGYSAVLEVMRTGKHVQNPSLNKAINKAIEENVAHITPEKFITKGLRSDLRSLIVAKKAFDTDSDTALTLEQANITDTLIITSATQSKTPSADLGLILKEQSFEALQKKMLKHFQSIDDTTVSWSDIPLENRKKLSQEFFMAWLVAPDIHENVLQGLDKNPSFKEGLLSAFDEKKELSDSLKIVDGTLKLLGVDPDAGSQNTAAPKGKTAAERAKEALEKQKAKQKK